MPTPLRLLRVAIIALVGCALAILTFGISLWITEHPKSLASTLPIESTIFYLKTNDASILQRWVKRFPSLEKPLPPIVNGTRYEFALLDASPSPAWVLSIYKGKIEGEETVSSHDTRYLLQSSKKGRGPLSQSSLLRRFATDEGATIAWADTMKLSTVVSPTPSPLQSLLLGAPHILMIDTAEDHGMIVLENVRLPRSLQRGMLDVATEKNGISISFQHLSALTSGWLQTLTQDDPHLAEGMHGIFQGMRDAWGIDASLEPIIERIASLPLSMNVRYDEKALQWYIVIHGSVPTNNDRQALIRALTERGGRGMTRTTALDAGNTVQDIIDETDIDTPKADNAWSRWALGGSPALWMALRGSSFVLSTDERALPSAEQPTESSTEKPVFLSAILSPSTLATMIQALLPFMSNDIQALQHAGFLTEQPIILTLESMNDSAIIRFSRAPKPMTPTTTRDGTIKKS